MIPPPLIQAVGTGHTPETLAACLRGEPGLILLRSALHQPSQGRYSLAAARPFLRFRSWGARCEVAVAGLVREQFGNPWAILDSWMSRCELLDQADLPFPLGGCFGYWGYDLKNFCEPRLPRRAANDLELPDCDLGFYASLVVFDHLLGRNWIISTGLLPDGSRDPATARRDADFWGHLLQSPPSEDLRRGKVEERRTAPHDTQTTPPESRQANALPKVVTPHPIAIPDPEVILSDLRTSLSRESFLSSVTAAQAWIRAGHIYQVNLSQRMSAPCQTNAWNLFLDLADRSPAPFAAFYNAGDHQVISSSPELFLRLSGSSIQTRPIKGTRPRDPDPARDARLSYELQTSPKEVAELVMITDLLRNDLGRVCEFGSIHVPELMRLERYAHVQHLVSTVEGRLRPEVSHFQALASCFPGGSVTGAPKIRAIEIIDTLEPVSRGPYTGALGYLGFNRESQLSIAIRIAILKDRHLHYHAGAGIVADSDPAAEYAETLAKAQAFLDLLATARHGSTLAPETPPSNTSRTGRHRRHL